MAAAPFLSRQRYRDDEDSPFDDRSALLAPSGILAKPGGDRDEFVDEDLESWPSSQARALSFTPANVTEQSFDVDGDDVDPDDVEDEGHPHQRVERMRPPASLGRSLRQVITVTSTLAIAVVMVKGFLFAHPASSPSSSSSSSSSLDDLPSHLVSLDSAPPAQLVAPVVPGGGVAGEEAEVPAFDYEKLDGSYCQNLAASRVAKIDAGVEGCKLACDNDPRCRYFQVFRGLSDCSLLTECPRRSRSSVGTFVMVKGVPKQDLLVAAMAGLHESPDEQALPMPLAIAGKRGSGPETFDCETNTAHWHSHWSPEHRQYCCSYQLTECSNGRPYNCRKDIPTWSTSWSSGKKDYCCNVYYDGCPSESNCTDSVYDWALHWPKEKKSKCCADGAVGAGCDLESLVPYNCNEDEHSSKWSSQMSAWCCAKHGRGQGCPEKSLSYECGELREGYRTAWAAWSDLKQAWCCAKKGIACPDPSSATTTGFELTTTTAFKPSHDCDVDANCWETCWSGDKQDYCCQHTNRGCPVITTTTAFPVIREVHPELTTTTPYPRLPRANPGLETTKPFLHPQGPSQPGLGFDLPSFNLDIFPSGPSGSEVEMTTTTNFEAFNCFIELYSEWTDVKKQWCCYHKGCCDKSCEPPTEFDCDAGFINWEAGWSDLKKTWCCAHRGNSCKSAAPPTTTQAISFDCTQGDVVDFSEAKKEFCCQHSGRGCPVHNNGNPIQFPSLSLPSISLPWAGGGGSGNGDLDTTTPFGQVPPTWPNPAPLPAPYPSSPALTTTMQFPAPVPAPPPVEHPDRPGWKARVSESCSEALEFLQNDNCDPEVLLKSIRRTCPSIAAPSKEACASWFGKIVGMSEASRQQEIKRCHTAVERAIDAALALPQVDPASHEEEMLCFQCQVTCYSQERPQMPTLPPPPRPGAFWSPDGSDRHCRPRSSDGEVEGVQKRVRKGVSFMTTEDWGQLNSALNKMEKSGTLQKYAQLFSTGLPPDDPTFLNFQNLPWSRHFLFDFETDLQVAANDCSLTLPYWAACQEATSEGLATSKIWGAQALGGQPVCQGGDALCSDPSVSMATQCSADEDAWCLGNGIAADWQVPDSLTMGQTGSASSCSCVHRSPGAPKARVGSCATVLPIYRMMEDFKSLSEVADGLRATMHCGQSTGSSSTLCTQSTAVMDPLFFVNYAFLDRIFFGWQRTHYIKNDIDVSDCYGCEMHMTHYHEPLAEWFGRADESEPCVLLPKSSPRACLYYVDEKE